MAQVMRVGTLEVLAQNRLLAGSYSRRCCRLITQDAAFQITDCIYKEKTHMGEVAGVGPLRPYQP